MSPLCHLPSSIYISLHLQGRAMSDLVQVFGGLAYRGNTEFPTGAEKTPHP